MEILTFSSMPTQKAIQRSVRKNRCITCNKRLGILPMICKCGAATCDLHRWPEHECDYDFKTEARKQLEKQIPLVRFDKMQYRI